MKIREYLTEENDLDKVIKMLLSMPCGISISASKPLFRGKEELHFDKNSPIELDKHCNLSSEKLSSILEFLYRKNCINKNRGQTTPMIYMLSCSVGEHEGSHKKLQRIMDKK